MLYEAAALTTELPRHIGVIQVNFGVSRRPVLAAARTSFDNTAFIVSAGHRTAPKKPSKPRPDFPLSPHAMGRSAKKTWRKMHCNGPWTDRKRPCGNTSTSATPCTPVLTPVTSRPRDWPRTSKKTEGALVENGDLSSSGTASISAARAYGNMATGGQTYHYDDPIGATTAANLAPAFPTRTRATFPQCGAQPPWVPIRDRLERMN